MFETIKRLYAKTGNEVLVENAVKKGWITPEEYAEIVGKEYGETVEDVEPEVSDAVEA